MKALLFDLDGTLADTAGDLIEATQRVLDDRGLPRRPFGELRPQVPNGSMALVAAAMGEHFPDDESAANELRDRLWQHYQQALYENPALYPGLMDIIEQWEARGLPWGVVTNKPDRFAEPLLEALGLSERLAVWLGGDSLPVKKPDPAPLIEAASRLGLPTADCVYVGDDRRDAEASLAAGMPCLVAAWDFIPEGEDPATWGTRGIVHDTRQLLDAIDDLN
ncbi:MAG: HAD family hydrolase [Pseudomonadota bacterium]